MSKSVRVEARVYPKTTRYSWDVEVVEYRIFGIKVWSSERLVL